MSISKLEPTGGSRESKKPASVHLHVQPARLAGNRLLFEGGVPIAVHSGGDIRYLRELEAPVQWEVKNLLIRRQQPASYVVPPPGLS